MTLIDAAHITPMDKLTALEMLATQGYDPTTPKVKRAAQYLELWREKSVEAATAAPTKPIDDELDNPFDLAVWLINFEFQDPKNRHMTYRELARIYANKIESYVERAITADRQQLLDRVDTIIGKNPPESEQWRYSNEPAGEIRLRKRQLEDIVKLRKELGL